MNVGCSWSGGKDSCYSLMKAIGDGNKPMVLLNMFNESRGISRSHGLTRNILEQQAKAMSVPLMTCESTWEEYERNYIATLINTKEEYKIDAFVFGDIDIESHKTWEVKVCKEAGIEAVLPIWHRERKELVFEMIDAGIVTMITSCNTDLGTDFLGKILSREVVEDLEQIGVDVCGENGEFHTVVIDCPLFNQPVILPKYNKKVVDNYCFICWA